MARIIFMGTPEYARIILQAIHSPHDQFLVVTKPDMPVGRRQKLMPPPVAVWAQEQGIRVDKPARLRDYRAEWEAFRPDWILTAAYGRILPPWALSLPKWGAYNLHASLLPRWRGPNPVAWAIRAGDALSGVTLMAMDEGMDTGGIVDVVKIPIEPNDCTQSLTRKLAQNAADLWLRNRIRVGLGRLSNTPQSQQGMSYAPKFESGEGHLDFHQSADVLDALVRSMTPAPGAYTIFRDQRIRVLKAKGDSHAGDGPVGTALLVKNDWTISTGKGRLVISAIQPSGRRPMTPGDFVRGRPGETEWLLT